MKVIKAQREPHDFAQLDRLFSPRSIGIYGASPNAASFGAKTHAHLQNFDGEVFLINRKYDDIKGVRCYRSVAEVPEKLDCVVIAVPREGVEEAARECAAAGVNGVVIYASGYSESGLPERIAQQERLSAIARESGMRIVGPNCMGFLSFRSRAEVTFATGAVKTDGYRPGGIAIISQSGAVGFAMAQAAFRGVSFTHLVAGGNACDVGPADCIAYFAQLPDCKAIVCVFEGLSDPHGLIRAGEIAHGLGKPVVVCKLGVSEEGAQAAASHSGSLAGAAEAWQAAFARGHMVQVRSVEAAIETAAFFSKAGACIAPGAGIVAVSGGAAVSATDHAAFHGVPVPQPSPPVIEAIRTILPPYGTPRNPCDVTAAVGNQPELLTECGRALASDPDIGIVIFPSTSVGGNTVARMSQLADACAQHGKLLCVAWMSGWLGGAGGVETEQHPNIALFHSLDTCFHAIAAWSRRAAQGAAAGVRGIDLHGAAASARAKLQLQGQTALVEREAKQVLSDYGLPVVGDVLVQSAAEAAHAAQHAGFPVVLKVESPKILHKTEAGVVRLNLRNAGEVEAAFAQVMANALTVVARQDITGVLVQPMVPAGVEIMLGSKTDPLFGPIVMVGLGGIFVEALKDVRIGLAPVSRDEALAMIAGLQGKALLDGFRGMPPVDRAKLADMVVRLSQLAADQAGLIEAIDVNPVICNGGRMLAVDALIIRKQPAVSLHNTGKDGV